jgi:hypothetical protein
MRCWNKFWNNERNVSNGVSCERRSEANFICEWWWKLLVSIQISLFKIYNNNNSKLYQCHKRDWDTRRDKLTLINMQLMTFNSLLMFDIVFIFFLFLVVVTCILYYIPPPTRSKKSSSLMPPSSPSFSTHTYGNERRRSQQSFTVASSVNSKNVLYVDGDNEPVESFIKCCKYCEKCKLIYEEIYSDRSYSNESKKSLSSSSSTNNGGSYLKAKDCDIKNCKGPIYEV